MVFLLKFQFNSNENRLIFVNRMENDWYFLSKSVRLTLEVFLGYSYEMANFHTDILIEAILLKESV